MRLHGQIRCKSGIYDDIDILVFILETNVRKSIALEKHILSVFSVGIRKYK